MGVSLKPSEAVEGGGFLDDVDVKVAESRFAMFDYGGSRQPVPAICFKLDHMDGSEPIAQYWSVGKATDWMPSDDGKELVPIGKATQLVNSSNGMLLLASIINAGFPESKLGDDISVFDGMEIHINRIAAPVRKGLKQKDDQTILTVTKIHKLPWDSAPAKGKATTAASKGKSGSKGGGGSKSKPAATAAATDIDAVATEFILTVLSDADLMKDFPDGLPKAKLAPETFARLKSDDPNRSSLLKRVFEDDFLNSGPWTYAGGKLTLG